MMGYEGVVKGNVIELDEPLPFLEGTRVEVTVTPKSEPRKNSPQAWLQLVGTLTEEEAEIILKTVHNLILVSSDEHFQYVCGLRSEDWTKPIGSKEGEQS